MCLAIDHRPSARTPQREWLASRLCLSMAVCLAPLLPTALCAAAIESVTLSDDGASLSLRIDRRTLPAPLTEDDQASFSDVLISDDRTQVGWLAHTRNCCTSYPLPMALVISDGVKVLARFRESHPIFDWAYADGGTAVIYRASWPHGHVPSIYKRRRISDGAVLSEYTCHSDNEKGGYSFDPPIPDWVWPVAMRSSCPQPAFMDTPCAFFFHALKDLPNERLWLRIGPFNSQWDDKPKTGCEVLFTTTDALLGSRRAPRFEASIGSELHQRGWRYVDQIAADGPGSSNFGIALGDVQCLISYHQPAELDEKLGIVHSETLDISVQCHAAHSR